MGPGSLTSGQLRCFAQIAATFLGKYAKSTRFLDNLP